MHASGTVAAVTELCQLYGAAGRWEDTIECWNGGVRDYPDHLDTFQTHSLLAEAHRRTFNHKLAARHYQAALVHEPRRPDLLLQLGMTQQFNLRHLRHAATTYSEALDMAASPEDAPMLLVALASVRLALGESTSAAKLFAQATGDSSSSRPSLPGPGSGSQAAAAQRSLQSQSCGCVYS